ncbi:MAG: hypothetical protein ING99_17095, partial [Rhodocyclaceae bacterium]|nr:hypothetical protein [Rhodocyclaceae bacterium]
FDFQAVWARRSTAVCWVEVLFKQQRRREIELRAIREDRGQEVVVDAFPKALTRVTRVALSGSQIDRLEVISQTRPTLIRVLTLDQIDVAKDWINPAAIPIATSAHTQLLGRPTSWAVGQALGSYRGPLLTHPLDLSPGSDPAAAPPIGPAKLDARYTDPWINTYEPLVARVLAESELRALTGGTRLHQSEVMDSAPVTTVSTPGGGLPDAAGQVRNPLSVSLYAGLMAAAASDFHLAKLLALGYVAEEPLSIHPGVWDYRLTGVWEAEDQQAIVGAIQRRADGLQQLLQAGKLDPTEAEAAQMIIGRASADIRQASDVVNRWTLRGTEALTLTAFALGVTPQAVAPVEAPRSVRLTTKPPAVPGRRTGEARLTWTPRRRARVSDGAGGDYAAIAWRSVSGQAEWINPPPADPIAMGGLQPLLIDESEANVIDRALPVNQTANYGVHVCDAWNRWSPVATGTARIEYLVPPPPVACEASLLPSTSQPGQARLRVRFRWDANAAWDGGRVNGAPAQMTFQLHLRASLPSTDPTSVSDWGACPLRSGSTAGPLIIPGSTPAATVTHDGVSVVIAAPVTLQEGGRTFRSYDLVIDPVQLPASANGLIEAFVAVRTQHATEGLCPTMGQAARAAYLPAVPPNEAIFPPDPLLATWADADGRSTAVLSWTQPAQPAAPDWGQVLWAGESELIASADPTNLTLSDPAQNATRSAALATLASATTTLGQQAQALKDLAVLSPSVFSVDQERVVLSAGPQRLLLTLPGALMTLRVYVVRPFTASGVTPPWPTQRDSFVVVKVPQAAFPVRPVVVGIERTTSGVLLRVQAPPFGTADVGSYELYRTQDTSAAGSGDFRRMRLIGRRNITTPDAPGSPDWTDWVWFDDDFEWIADAAGVLQKRLRSRKIVQLTDPSPPAIGVSYYCVVARTRDAAAASQGRSPPSVPAVIGAE